MDKICEMMEDMMSEKEFVKDMTEILKSLGVEVATTVNTDLFSVPTWHEFMFILGPRDSEKEKKLCKDIKEELDDWGVTKLYLPIGHTNNGKFNITFIVHVPDDLSDEELGTDLRTSSDKSI